MELPPVMPIIPSSQTTYYRNKLEFTFSNRKWLTDEDMKKDGKTTDNRALGFHMPGMFDRVLDIDTCYLIRCSA